MTMRFHEEEEEEDGSRQLSERPFGARAQPDETCEAKGRGKLLMSVWERRELGTAQKECCVDLIELRGAEVCVEHLE